MKTIFVFDVETITDEGDYRLVSGRNFAPSDVQVVVYPDIVGADLLQAGAALVVAGRISNTSPYTVAAEALARYLGPASSDLAAVSPNPRRRVLLVAANLFTSNPF